MIAQGMLTRNHCRDPRMSWCVSNRIIEIIHTNTKINLFDQTAETPMHTLPNPSASVSHEIFATLCAALPAPASDTPENRVARDETAMAAVAALHPIDAFEAKLAAEIVVADAYVMEAAMHPAAVERAGYWFCDVSTRYLPRLNHPPSLVSLTPNNTPPSTPIVPR